MDRKVESSFVFYSNLFWVLGAVEPLHSPEKTLLAQRPRVSGLSLKRAHWELCSAFLFFYVFVIFFMTMRAIVRF